MKTKLTTAEENLLSRLRAMRSGGMHISGADVRTARRLEKAGVVSLEDNGSMKLDGVHEDGERWWVTLLRPIQAVRIEGDLPVEILTLARLSDGELVVEVARLIHAHDIGTPNDPGWSSDAGATTARLGISGYPIYRLTSLSGDEDLVPESHTWVPATLDEDRIPGLLAGWNRGDGEVMLRLPGRALVSLQEDTILGIGDDEAAALEDARAVSQAGGEFDTTVAYCVPVTAKARSAYHAGRKEEITFDMAHGFVLHNSETS